MPRLLFQSFGCYEPFSSLTIHRGGWVAFVERPHFARGVIWVIHSTTMKTLALLLAIIFAAGMSWADDGDAPPKPPPFRPWQEVWQCNDVRVTITSRSPEEIEYDLGGMIWGGSRFTVVRGNFFFNGRPCVPLRPVGY